MTLIPRTVLLFALLYAASACKADSSELHVEAEQLKSELGACVSGDTCVAIAPENDCLGGALVCGFAVPSPRAEEARTRAQSIADDSMSLNPCEMAECAGHGKPTCDAKAGRCVFQ